MEDLIEFPIDVIAGACRQWRRRPDGRRPTPGQIRALCVEDMELRRVPDLAALPAPDWQQRLAEKRRAQSEVMQQEGRAAADTWARARGHEDFDAYLAGGGSYGAAIRAMTSSVED